MLALLALLAVQAMPAVKCEDREIGSVENSAI